MSKDTPQFADFTWPSRWNKAEQAAILSQSGAEVHAVNFMGVIRFRLDDDESVAAIVNHARRFAEAVETMKQEFDGTCDRCGGGPARRWSSEICQTCDPVLLCAGCFATHAAEAAADRVEGLGG
jgi:hypothetical protein